MTDDDRPEDRPAEPRPTTRGLIPHLSPEARPGFVGDPVHRHRPSTSGLSMVGMTALIYGGLTLAAVAWAYFMSGRFVWLHPMHVAEADHYWRHALLGAVAGVGLGLLVVLASRLLTARSDLGKRLHMEFHEVLVGLRTRDAFWLALFSAVGEEALFRGVLQPALGLLLTSAVFGLVHVPLRRALWPWPLLAFSMGLAFGALFEKFGDLGGPVIAHFLINFLNLRHISRVSFPGFGAPRLDAPSTRVKGG